MKTIYNNLENEIIINKSRFICNIYKVYNEEEVSKYLEEIKEKYKDATHYCYSYIIDNTKRFNDNGEPQGTAGMPILNVLENNDLNYVLCIVTRYFGGIKLGAGGLVRAYSKSAAQALENADFRNIVNGKNVIITFNYDKVKLIDKALEDIDIKNKSFDEVITYSFDINNNKLEQIKEILTLNTLSINISKDILIEEKN